jgi:hypothetical protein
MWRVNEIMVEDTRIENEAQGAVFFSDKENS